MRNPGANDWKKYAGNGFEYFKQAFIDAYQKEDFEVISMFVPIAEALSKKGFPQMIGDQTPEQQKFTIKGLVEKLKPLFSAMFPTTLSFDQAKELGQEVAEEVSPGLALILQEIDEEGRLHKNRTFEEQIIKFAQKDIDDGIKEIEQLQAELAELQTNGAEEWRIHSLNNRIQVINSAITHHKESIEKLENIIESGKGTKAPTCYYRSTDDINIVPEKTAHDAIAIVHEGGHATTRSYLQTGCGLLPELPAITAELVGSRYLEKNGMSEVRDFTVRRVVDLQKSAKSVLALNEVFSEYETTGDITYQTVNDAIIMSGWNREGKPPEEYSHTDVNIFRDIIKESGYFIGTTAGLSLNEKIKGKSDMENVFHVMGDDTLNDKQKLDQMDVTQENMIGSMNNFVRDNKIHLNLKSMGDKIGKVVDDFSKPIEKAINNMVESIADR